jgi:hypothetical protein
LSFVKGDGWSLYTYIYIPTENPLIIPFFFLLCYNTHTHTYICICISTFLRGVALVICLFELFQQIILFFQ